MASITTWVTSAVMICCLTGWLAGCDAKGISDWRVAGKASPAADARPVVPEPLNLLLPQKVRIHPFTGTRTFDPSGGVTGLDVRVEAQDSYGDPTKAFGDFNFALYSYDPRSPDVKDKRLASWHESLLEPKGNILHWDTIAKRYQFRLKWDHPIPVGQKFVLTVSFASPFTERLDDEHIFVSGQ